MFFLEFNFAKKCLPANISNKATWWTKYIRGSDVVLNYMLEIFSISMEPIILVFRQLLASFYSAHGKVKTIFEENKFVSDVGDAPLAVGKRLGDVNKVLVQTTIEILVLMAAALGKKFAKPHIKTVLIPLIQGPVKKKSLKIYVVRKLKFEFSFPEKMTKKSRA